MSRAAGSLADVSNRAIREMLGTHSISRALINLQDATATMDVVNEPDAIGIVSIGGATVKYDDAANVALAAVAALQNPVTGQDTFYVQPADTTVYYLVVCNAAGALKVIQGTYADQVLSGSLAIGPRGDGSIPFVAVADSYAPVAVLKVVTTGVTFTPATTNWNAAGVVAYAAPCTVVPASADVLVFVEGGA